MEEVARLIGVTESQQESGMAHARALLLRPKMEKWRIKRLGNSKKPFPIKQNVLY